MATHVSHAGIPLVKGARFTIPVPYLDSAADPTDPTTPDTERSIDGAAFADCTEEVTTITGSNGMGFLTLTGDETNCSLLAVAAKAASGPKTTLFATTIRPSPSISTGTAQAGGNTSITLAAGAPSYDLTGCIVKTTGGTGGGGGSGSRDNQARIIAAYNGTTKVATVEPAWETNPDATTTYAILSQGFSLASVLGTPAGASIAADIAAIWTTVIAEAYAADGAPGTPAQLLYMIQQAITEFAISGTTKTIKKLDGSTTAATETLDSADNPTSITRAT